MKRPQPSDELPGSSATVACTGRTPEPRDTAGTFRQSASRPGAAPSATPHDANPMDDIEAPPTRLRRIRLMSIAPVARLHRTMGDIAPSVFLREWLRHPGAVGAVWPSSDYLARRMAACVPRSGDGLVIELGAGTGCVTQALLERGIRADRLVVVERSHNFVVHLRRRFPSVTVLHGDALRLAELLPPRLMVDAIVSSLPLRSLPPSDARTIVAQWERVLRAGGRAVQFSYDLRNRLRYEPSGLRQRSSHVVWANVPPARIFTLEAARSPAVDAPEKARQAPNPWS